jgi:hypothetical protein
VSFSLSCAFTCQLFVTLPASIFCTVVPFDAVVHVLLLILPDYLLRIHLPLNHHIQSGISSIGCNVYVIISPLP